MHSAPCFRCARSNTSLSKHTHNAQHTHDAQRSMLQVRKVKQIMVQAHSQCTALHAPGVQGQIHHCPRGSAAQQQCAQPAWHCHSWESKHMSGGLWKFMWEKDLRSGDL
eukprot:1159762-Pelagomonas_calceolata.AAC.11